MKRKTVLILVLVLAMAALAACGGGGKSSKSIWSDVPIPPDAKGSDVRLPLPLRLLIQTAMRASASSNDVDVDKFDFVGYTTTQTPQQVADFYSTERMGAAGWQTAEGLGCTTGMDEQSSVGGGFCMFTKDDGGQQSVLFIALANEDNAKETNIFFVRFDGQFSGQ
ncbi:MAG TPA: hypothetical protein PK170_10675 [Anaerolineae bacterium]|nr:hypothetical protein [Anaerolineae bacterium]